MNSVDSCSIVRESWSARSLDGSLGNVPGISRQSSLSGKDITVTVSITVSINTFHLNSLAIFCDSQIVQF